MLKPTYEVFVVKDAKKEGDKPFWTKVGAAWEHGDKEGLNVVLDFPIGVTEVTLRKPTENPAT